MLKAVPHLSADGSCWPPASNPAVKKIIEAGTARSAQLIENDRLPLSIGHGGRSLLDLVTATGRPATKGPERDQRR